MTKSQQKKPQKRFRFRRKARHLFFARGEKKTRTIFPPEAKKRATQEKRGAACPPRGEKRAAQEMRGAACPPRLR